MLCLAMLAPALACDAGRWTAGIFRLLLPDNPVRPAPQEFSPAAFDRPQDGDARLV